MGNHLGRAERSPQRGPGVPLGDLLPPLALALTCWRNLFSHLLTWVCLLTRRMRQLGSVTFAPPLLGVLRFQCGYLPCLGQGLIVWWGRRQRGLRPSECLLPSFIICVTSDLFYRLDFHFKFHATNIIYSACLCKI